MWTGKVEGHPYSAAVFVTQRDGLTSGWVYLPKMQATHIVEQQHSGGGMQVVYQVSLTTDPLCHCRHKCARSLLECTASDASVQSC